MKTTKLSDILRRSIGRFVGTRPWERARDTELSLYDAKRSLDEKNFLVKALQKVIGNPKAENDWRPLHTAPKDRPILVCSAEGHVNLVTWDGFGGWSTCQHCAALNPLAWREIPKPARVPECHHAWLDARNDVVKSGEVCLHCGKLRPGNSFSTKYTVADVADTADTAYALTKSLTENGDEQT